MDYVLNEGFLGFSARAPATPLRPFFHRSHDPGVPQVGWRQGRVRSWPWTGTEAGHRGRWPGRQLAAPAGRARSPVPVGPGQPAWMVRNQLIGLVGGPGGLVLKRSEVQKVCVCSGCLILTDLRSL